MRHSYAKFVNARSSNDRWCALRLADDGMLSSHRTEAEADTACGTFDDFIDRNYPDAKLPTRRVKFDRVRSASESPGLFAELLSILPNFVPWELFTPPIYKKSDYEDIHRDEEGRINVAAKTA